MGEGKKVLHMTFATAEGGTFKISLSNTVDNLTPTHVKDTMETIIDANVFATSKGDIVSKKKAYFVTQEVEELGIG